LPVSAEMVATARRHRVHLILAETLQSDDLEDEAAVASLRAERARASLVDAIRTRMLRDVLDELESAGIPALLLKGAGVAHTIYSAPHLRPRDDLDVMVPQDSVGRAEDLLSASGWRRQAESGGDLHTAQRHYVRGDPSGVLEQVDLHWKIANPHIFRDAVSFDELWAHSIPIPTLGVHARTLSPADALFLACLHRVAHHQDDLDLLWLWDIHLIVSGLSPEGEDRFVELAERPASRGMRSVCLRGLELARARYGENKKAGAGGARPERLGVGPQAVSKDVLIALIARLRESIAELGDPSNGPVEASSQFIGGRLSQVDLLRTDLFTLPGWRDRLLLVGEHLFPSAAYMRSRYPRWPRPALPLAYIHRVFRGAPNWFRH
ncbi:MAG TPA: nucleotidyltransferase family protein, partial [Vicinamibacterales bacterium]|nr:nucleotidyltransferase family protein [Vicinamibacterales bacterium]